MNLQIIGDSLDAKLKLSAEYQIQLTESDTPISAALIMETPLVGASLSKINSALDISTEISGKSIDNETIDFVQNPEYAAPDVRIGMDITSGSTVYQAAALHTGYTQP